MMMEDAMSNSIAESKEASSVASGTNTSNDTPSNTRTTPASNNTPAANDLRYAAQRISNDIASTINALGATFLSPAQIKNGEKGNANRIIDACWLVPEEPATATKVAGDPSSFQKAVPRIKGELAPDDNSSQDNSNTSLSRIRNEQDDGTGTGTTTPGTSSRNKQEVAESWKRKMKLAQKKKEREANDSINDGGNDTKNEGDTAFRKDDENSQPPRRKREDGGPSNMLDPIFNAAMSFSEMPNSRKEIMDLVAGCPGMFEREDDDSTGSEETEWSESTPESPRRRRRKHRSRRSRKDGFRKKGSGRSRRSAERNRRSSPRKHRGGQHSPPDDASSIAQSELTMTPERKDYSKPASPPRRRHQRTPPSTEQLETTFENEFPTPHRSRPRSSTEKWRPTTKSPSRSSRKQSPTARVNPKDKNFIKIFIDEINNKGYRMMWYRERSSSKPSTVVLFLKHGNRDAGSGTHSGPAMVWVDESEENQFYGVNLFDIRTLDRATVSMLGERSFAMPSRSIFLRLAKGNEFIFEASTEQEAFRFVHGMKWVIARLAFNLVIGNMNVVCELVDVPRKKRGENHEAKTARAMDEVTLQMVDKSILKIV